jgi:hypothetical protein
MTPPMACVGRPLIGACVVSGHALDALNPQLMLRVIHGLGAWYPLLFCT